MFHNILTVVLLAIIVLSLVFFVSSKIFINIIYNFTNRKINPAIEDSKLQKSKGFTKLKFFSRELNFEMSCFLNFLHEIGMDIENKKSK